MRFRSTIKASSVLIKVFLYLFVVLAISGINFIIYNTSSIIVFITSLLVSFLILYFSGRKLLKEIFIINFEPENLLQIKYPLLSKVENYGWDNISGYSFSSKTQHNYSGYNIVIFHIFPDKKIKLSEDAIADYSEFVNCIKNSNLKYFGYENFQEV